MFEYFPDNYGWSLSFMMALGMGAEITELDDICAPLRDAAAAGDEKADLVWLEKWAAGGKRVADSAAKDEKDGHQGAASRKWLRAATYYILGERQVAPKTDVSLEVYRKGLEAFRRGIELGHQEVEFVEVPFEGESFPALFIPAADRANAPCIIHFGGLDAMKEILFMYHADALRDGRVSMLICDHPGIGEAVRFRDLHLTPATEKPAGACLDYLEGRGDVPMDRTGIIALSFGGYFAPRAAALDPRLKFCAAWGAIWNTRACIENCLENATGSVPLLGQFRYVFGVDTDEEAWRLMDECVLEPYIDKLTCPLLVLHGENDRQAPAWTAEKTYEGAVNSVRRDLVMIPRDEIGTEHCQADAVSVAVDILHDWVHDVMPAK